MSPATSVSARLFPRAPVSAPARTSTWRIAAGQAMSLRAASDSLLQVHQGRLWVTRDATARCRSEDLVISSQEGTALHVSRGGRIVIEPWGREDVICSWQSLGT